jgi:signal transduction histidine kinase
MAYNWRMERVLDKLIVFALSAFMAGMLPFSFLQLAAILTAISISALYDADTLPSLLRTALVYAYCGLCFCLPGFLAFIPLISYDCFRAGYHVKNLSNEIRLVLRLAWLAPLLCGLFWLQPVTVFLLLILSSLACLRAWQCQRQTAILADYRQRRDELSALSQSLELKNRDLEERQSLELRLATLAERSRIAREIHDNVGHLLTRSMLQVEAMQVLHTGDDEPADQLAGVSDTLREAYEAVRHSVHSLHEDSFELQVQLMALVQETESLSRNSAGLDASLKITLDYDLDSDSPPQAISYSLLAIVRESLSNTLKHSDATTVTVSVLEFPGLYQLTIHDNGSTEPSKAAINSGGIGLANMEERTRALGGVFYTSWDKGFKVFASIPKKTVEKA